MGSQKTNDETEERVHQQQRPTIKCVVWDLDNTLWDDVLLENEQVSLCPGVLEVIKLLDSRGILQSIASKNDHTAARKKLEEFSLSEYFLYPQINWNTKSSSILEIARLLNINIDTFAFIDDNAFERDEVKFSIPQITCIDAKNIASISTLPEVNPRFITEDSRKRRQMYLNDIARNHAEKEFTGPNEAFLATLGMVFEIAPAHEEDLKRAEELTVRTHQLNATGMTYSYEELDAFRQSDQYLLLVCELTDRYGSYGKIGIALVEMQTSFWHIKLLLMSCRVISYGVGTVLLTSITHRCHQEGKQLLADFRHTERNKMMYVSYRFANFKEIATEADGTLLLENSFSTLPSFPEYIELKEAY